MHLLRRIETVSTDATTIQTPEELHALLTDTRRRRTIAALADAGVTPSRFLLWGVLAVQLVGLLATMDPALQTALLE